MTCNNSPLVSVTVPVYNNSNYLRQCLDSLQAQTLKEIEFILVDDGSTDDSGRICDEYAKRDSRFRVIHQKNGGLAVARQTALEVSKGLYFCTCDADDWVELDMYERLYKKAVDTDADIVMCDYWSEYPNGRQVSTVYGKDPSQRLDLFDDALNGKFPPQVWSKMFKREEIFQKYSLFWESGINLGEDYLLTLKILQNDVKVVYVPCQLYHYRREFGGNSYTNKVTMNTFRQSLFIRQWVVGHVDTEKYANGIFRLWLALCFTALRVREGMSARYYRQDILSHVPYRGFLKYHYPKTKGLVVFFAKLFGYKSARGIYRLCYKFVYH